MKSFRRWFCCVFRPTLWVCSFKAVSDARISDGSPARETTATLRTIAPTRAEAERLFLRDIRYLCRFDGQVRYRVRHAFPWEFR